MDLGCAGVEGLEDALGAPEEHARIPEELTRPEEHTREVLVGLFGESLHFREMPLDGFSHLYVAIPSLWPAGLDAHGHEGIAILDEGKGVNDALLEPFSIDNQVIARGNHHLGLGVDGLNMVSSPCNARRGIAAHRLHKNLAVIDFRQLLLDEFAVALVGDEDDILVGNDTLQAVKRHLQEAASCTEEVDELFGACGLAEGPKSAAHTAAHDHAVSVIVHDYDVV